MLRVGLLLLMAAVIVLVGCSDTSIDATSNSEKDSKKVTEYEEASKKNEKKEESNQDKKKTDQKKKEREEKINAMTDEDYFIESDADAYVTTDNYRYHVIDFLGGEKKDVFLVAFEEITGVTVTLLSYNEQLEEWTQVYKDKDSLHGHYNYVGMIEEEHKDHPTIVGLGSEGGNYASVVTIDYRNGEFELSNFTGELSSGGRVVTSDDMFMLESGNSREYFIWDESEYKREVKKVSAEEAGAVLEILYEYRGNYSGEGTVTVTPESDRYFQVQAGDKILIGPNGDEGDEFRQIYPDGEHMKKDEESELWLYEIVGEPGDVAELLFDASENPTTFTFEIIE